MNKILTPALSLLVLLVPFAVSASECNYPFPENITLIPLLLSLVWYGVISLFSLSVIIKGLLLFKKNEKCSKIVNRALITLPIIGIVVVGINLLVYVPSFIYASCIPETKMNIFTMILKTLP